MQAIFEHIHRLRSNQLPGFVWTASQLEEASDELPLSSYPCELDDLDVSNCVDAPVDDGAWRL